MEKYAVLFTNKHILAIAIDFIDENTPNSFFNNKQAVHWSAPII